VFPQAAAIAAKVTPDQYRNATPCSEWDVHTLLNHMISSHHMFTSILSDEVPLEPLDEVGDDPGGAYRKAIEASLAAFKAPDALDKVMALPPGPMPGSNALGMLIMDNLVHGWDLAKGTGQEAEMDPLIATGYLEQMRQVPLPRQPAEGAVFGPEIAVPEDASPTAKLVGFLGRQP
jgi:uncharacterized protein (TIGR03086 family)